MSAAGRTVEQGGRAKAYRPLPASARREALAAFLAAYDRGDAFLAHELLEPAWMGTAELPERELYQGLIKLAAAHVHWVRGNARGVVKNLSGARAHLSLVESAEPGGAARDGAAAATRTLRLDLPALLTAIDAELGALDGGVPLERTAPIELPRRRRSHPDKSG
ncbi:MAG: DUF309 domain-containing protein [Candidatus Limnocylindrales bacterium]